MSKVSHPEIAVASKNVGESLVVCMTLGTDLEIEFKRLAKAANELSRAGMGNNISFENPTLQAAWVHWKRSQNTAEVALPPMMEVV